MMEAQDVPNSNEYTERRVTLCHGLCGGAHVMPDRSG